MKQRETVKLVLWLAWIASTSSISIDLCLSALPEIEAGLHMAVGRGGHIASAFFAGFILIPILGGLLLDLFGRNFVLVASASSYVVGSLICAMTNTDTVFLMGRLLQGAAAGCLTTIPLTVLSSSFSGVQSKRLNAEVTSISAAVPILMPYCGVFLLHHFGWRSIFGTQALSMFLLCLFGYYFVHDSMHAQRDRHDIGIELVKKIHVVLTDRQFLNYVAIYGLMYACAIAYISTSPLMLISVMKLTGIHFASIFALNAIGHLLGAVISTILLRRGVSANLTILAGLLLMLTSSACALFLFSLFPQSISIYMIFTWIMIFGFGIAVPSITVGALEFLSAFRGVASGVMRSSFYLLGTLTSAGLAEYCSMHPDSINVFVPAVMTATAGLGLVLFVLHRLHSRKVI